MEGTRRRRQRTGVLFLLGCGQLASGAQTSSPVLLPDAFNAVLLSGTTPGSDKGQCAQSVVNQLAPTVAAAAASNSWLGVGGTTTLPLDVAVSSNTCSSCLQDYHSCPTGVSAGGRSLDYQPVPWTWKWRCRAATASHAELLNLGPGQPAAHLTPCRLQSSVALILVIVLPAVAAGVLCGFSTACLLRRRRRLKLQQGAPQGQLQQVPSFTTVVVDATHGGYAPEGPGQQAMGLPVFPIQTQGGQTRGMATLPVTPPPTKEKGVA